jgi:polyferredoxin
VHFGFSKVYDPASFLATVMVALAALAIPNVWCRYLCPWRCVISWTARNSLRTIETDKSKCTECGKCTEVCNVDAVKNGKINPDECHFCMKCVDICPSGVFSIKDDWKRNNEAGEEDE